MLEINYITMNNGWSSIDDAIFMPTLDKAPIRNSEGWGRMVDTRLNTLFSMRKIHLSRILYTCLLFHKHEVGLFLA